MAIEYLMENPWKPGDSWVPGDLLWFVLMDKSGYKAEFWKQRPDLWFVMESVMQQALAQFPSLTEREQELATLYNPPTPELLKMVLDSNKESKE